MRDKPRWEIIHGDSLTVLESFPPSTFDAVITDPPYASGGRTQAEKSKATAKKYSSMGGNAPLILTATPRISGRGPAGRQSGCILQDVQLSPARRFVCLLTGGSFPAPAMRSSGRAGSGAGSLFGIRETHARRRGVFGNRQNTSSGARTEICRSAALCRACQVCSNMAIRRTAST